MVQFLRVDIYSATKQIEKFVKLSHEEHITHRLHDALVITRGPRLDGIAK